VAEASENIKGAVELYLGPEEDIKMVEGMQVLEVELCDEIAGCFIRTA